MPPRRITAALVTATAALVLTGCSGDDLFSNMNGTRSASAEPPSPASSRPPIADAPPNYGDNSRVRRPKPMTPRDEQAATHLARDVRRVLETQREQGRISPAEVRRVLEDLVAPARLDVGNRRTGTAPAVQADGSTFGVFVDSTACVNGAVSERRVWVSVTGHYPETGCVEPLAPH
ncbi:hypothetical protein [Streptomyces sp. NPDC052225]|uniref:hypothetical protein n=1 Tax=Streptomyces sp. NPDC052225 TaxID=3154949 RepID=UPI003412DFC7